MAPWQSFLLAALVLLWAEAAIHGVGSPARASDRHDTDSLLSEDVIVDAPPAQRATVNVTTTDISSPNAIGGSGVL